MKLFYSPAYVAEGPIETVEKAAWIVDSLGREPVPGVELCEPPLLPAEALTRVHDAAWIEAVRTGEPRVVAESQSIPWSASLFPSALASTSGVVAAARAAMADGGVAGSLSAGLHHARRGRGAGFCTFNGLALAALLALDEGARSVLILDLDAHCGGGTWSLVSSDPRVRHVDVATSDFDCWPSGGRGTLVLVEHDAHYLAQIDHALATLDAEGERYDLCLYNAGVDICTGFPDDDITAATVEARERKVFDWCRARSVPTAFVLAGGYLGRHLQRDGLVALHLATIRAATGA